MKREPQRDAAESKATPKGHSDAVDLPQIGRILKRLRIERKLSTRDVAKAVGLSTSFINALERETTDISLGRLARLAAFFGHDLGSFLGFTTRLSRANFVAASERAFVDRGKGVRYEILRLHALGLEAVLLTISPKCGFRDDLIHEGVDVVIVTDGEIIASIHRVDYVMKAGDCMFHSAGYEHSLRNKSNRVARAVLLTTGDWRGPSSRAVD